MEDYKFVQIGKKKFPVRFGFNALRKFSTRTGMGLQDFDKLGADMSLDSALQLIFCGIEDGYRKAKQPNEISCIDDLADLIDTDYEAIERCMNILTSMLTTGAEKKKNAKKEKK
tara:strand:- start:2207 stop:2548 length:342 start_codon:yes stop_codon:yes gene_type:complete